MNGYDLFTWVMALVLGGSAVVIFAYFLRDARKILDRTRHGEDDDSP